jgi:hypothetical protein
VKVEFDTPKAIARERKRLADEREALDKEKQEIREQSTEVRLEKNRVARLANLLATGELQTAEARMVQQQAPDPRAAELVEEAKMNLHREQGLSALGRPPEEYIRANAMVHFRAKRDEAAEQIAKIEKCLEKPNVSLGGRQRAEVDELRLIVDAWPNVEKACRIGEEMFALRERRKEIVAEQAQLAETRRRNALAVA